MEMKHAAKIAYCALSLFFLSCNFIPCEKVTDKDVAGYYVSCNPKNKNKQYIELLDDKTLIMVYCNGDSIIKENGTWDRYNGCRTRLDGIRWFNIPLKDTARYDGFFNWVRGKLAMGEDSWSFQKTWRKPKLACEK
jgi:hypothetical protein